VATGPAGGPEEMNTMSWKMLAAILMVSVGVLMFVGGDSLRLIVPTFLR
jgi:hypothetical protein